MSINKTSVRRNIRTHRPRRFSLVRRFGTARDGSVPAEFAFIVGFAALLLVTGVVLLGESVTENYTQLSSQIETASFNMPNPLGSGNAGEAASDSEGSVGEESANNGNAGGNGKGKGNN